MAAPREEHGPAETPESRRSTGATPSPGKRARRAADTSESSTPSTYTGRRVARRTTPDQFPSSPATVGTSLLLEAASDRMAGELPDELAPSEAASRRARARRSGRRWRHLPGLPTAIGLAATAVAAIGGVGTATTGATTAADDPATDSHSQVQASGALTGSSAAGITGIAEDRGTTISRGQSRTAAVAKTDASGKEAAGAEATAADRQQALTALNKRASDQAQALEADQWGLPIPAGDYHITNTFGMARSYYASTHTGLDFAAPEGTPIHAIARGVVTSTGYDGAYGNKTVVTLEDGTEIWYCHQTSFAVSPGDSVTTGEVIGHVGSTGNVTGPHVHVEVRPGGGDPVDPMTAMQHEGLDP
ncbi:M23 family metallopeptidase [Nocardioides insulae]|uniref:M23 family metallopeptidase n=1 Tax=Nocardioides insulae TaxID=394734 RepID=UPI001B7FD987|nr:M23 family metallopeptidase [Nocardioides insulae]